MGFTVQKSTETTCMAGCMEQPRGLNLKLARQTVGIRVTYALGKFWIMENNMETTIGVILGVYWDNSPL